MGTRHQMIKRKRKWLRAVQDASAEHAPPTGPKLPLTGGAAFPVSRERLSQMREADPTLWECFAKVVSNDKQRDEKVAYLLWMVRYCYVNGLPL
ncbi:hypothetical protein JOB18_015688 [Solea senegalensis]|uniref:Uncharacterized protein n=1 Tax=Solea senegalensis TaxID=28829 RepID=A0AAV6RH30_SOLSE|nr:hypothetical protein JOB18_015688 [Solea senegalensis]